MKKLLFLLLLFANRVLAQNVTGYMTVSVPGAASTQALKDSIAKLSKQIADLKLAGVKGDKGDPGYTPKKGIDYFDGKNGVDGKSIVGPPGPQGPPGTSTGGGGVNLFSIKSVKDFGAIPNDGIDDYQAIQNGIDYCLNNNIRTLFFPLGNYNLSHPLIVFKQNSFSTIELLGETSFWESNQGSELIPDFTNTFVIGLQNNKGSKIRKLFIQGKFQPPSSSDRNKFFNIKFEDFTDGVCRDSRFSPYSAIVIDPFTNHVGDLDTGWQYPGLENYYGKSPAVDKNTGSTGTEIEEMIINNFVVGILESPNGSTRNAEISILNKIQFENCKVCIQSCQAQEKGNVASNIYCWGGTHTVFATDLYGAYGAGNWHVDHCNIAGAVIRFMYNNEGAWFPTYISHVFAESLGSFGTLNSGIAAEIYDCHIDFEIDENGNPRTQGSLITSYGENVVYRSCNFRFYNGVYPSAEIKVEGNPYFDHCYFTDYKSHNVVK